METKFANTFNYFNFGSLKQLKNANPAKEENAIKVAAQHLESVFLELVLKSMDDANAAFKSHVYERDTEDFFHGMFNQQLALTLSQAGGVGLADVIVRQLTKQRKNAAPELKLHEMHPSSKMINLTREPDPVKPLNKDKEKQIKLVGILEHE